MLGLALVAPLATLGACGDDDDGRGTEADYYGVGASCQNDDQCRDEGQVCLPFKDGYCGIEGCTADEDCPQGSACVIYDDGNNYCFLLCRDKPDCNLNRPLDGESNCVSSITYVEGDAGHGKACEPPSG
jgi:hypothetical protein